MIRGAKKKYYDNGRMDSNNRFNIIFVCPPFFLTYNRKVNKKSESYTF